MRTSILHLLAERAATTTELAEAVGRPKGTIDHHLKVLQRAGLVDVVRTRQVRALTERFWGRTARTILIGSVEGAEARMTITFLAHAMADFRAARPGFTTLRYARIPVERVDEFARRLDALAMEFLDERRGGDAVYGLLLAVYPTNQPALAGSRTDRTTADDRHGETPPHVGTTADRSAPRYRKVFTASVISNLGDGVSQIGYPWLASAVTRNPILIALVAVAQRLPWLVFTLPAGVITDRVDRRKAMVLMDIFRGVLTAARRARRARPRQRPARARRHRGRRRHPHRAVPHPRRSSLLLGFAEVLRDNSAQTIIPSIVEPDQLERANGRMWSAEQVANTFVGPPLGSLLIAGAFFLPFALDSVSFFAAAGLVVLIAGQFRGPPRPTRPRPRPRGAWKARAEGGRRLAVAPRAAAPDGDHPRDA